MASEVKTEPGGLTSGPFICPSPNCQRLFKRACDLNKHSKSHSRPFKCADPGCKYHDKGWPTAKELERHVNDKHSAAPKTFPCLFPDCSYESKRDSNRKQHMEKAHGWQYTRSKRRAPQDHQTPEIAALTPPDSCATATSESVSLPPHDQDFILYPSDNAGQQMNIDDEEEDYDLDDVSSHDQSSQTYVPWTSPNTRLRRNETLLENFDQQYDGSHASFGSNDLMIDPDLPRYMPTDFGDDKTSVKPEPESTTLPQDEFTSRPNNDRRGSGGQTQPQRSSTPENGQSKLISSSDPISKSLGFSSRSTTDRRHKREDDSPEPRKRQKHNEPENFTDLDMPCIFRFAHPTVYDRDRKDKYAPCHSSHREISTLVRHLSRPAHDLQVDARMVSSFDIRDRDYPHPRVGLCRQCWESFSEREAFDEHLSHPCIKQSKGKREKWRALKISLTPMTGERRVSVHANRHGDDLSWIEEDDTETGPSFDNTTPAFPTTNNAELSAPACSAHTKDFVHISEHRKLQRENSFLRKENKLLRSYCAQEEGHGVAGSLAESFYGEFALRTRTADGRISDTASDQRSLIHGMTSQFTDVDVHGLMHEAPDVLSGQKSIDRSAAVYHVPNSPPPVQSQSEFESHDKSQNTGGKSCDRLAVPRPPASVADSAYGTDERRGSLNTIQDNSFSSNNCALPELGDEQLRLLGSRSRSFAMPGYDEQAFHGAESSSKSPFTGRRGGVTGYQLSAVEETMTWSNPNPFGAAPMATGGATVPNTFYAADEGEEPPAMFDSQTFDVNEYLNFS